ncbi:pyridoxamine 5'-phosphate oxidase family protein [Paraglaciecola sp. L1A13]|uniref:pyridoxamine 5'-phosphate oxidase family protein n=1 Tax=Paraglaciecola sp. L1A13 TaxID=2686359 RepID=UPI00131B0DA0|nr:pyridoxamine 5'-phosphate oxidase family protein [Paraglaciecola sp. L1A13]|tara:strand:- start:630 stop:1094 length:465 start_codon:yes stop_codon:yes gene_type:complete
MSQELREKMWKSMADSPVVMLGLNNSKEHSEPMYAQLDKDANSAFWFYTTKTNRCAAGGAAMAQFSSKDHKLFACISGNLVEETDPKVVDKYWSKHVAAWYKDGRDDPSLKMMRLDLNDAEVWHADPDFSAIVNLTFGGKIKPEKMGEHQKVPL